MNKWTNNYVHAIKHISEIHVLQTLSSTQHLHRCLCTTGWGGGFGVLHKPTLKVAQFPPVPCPAVIVNPDIDWSDMEIWFVIHMYNLAQVSRWIRLDSKHFCWTNLTDFFVLYSWSSYRLWLMHFFMFHTKISKPAANRKRLVEQFHQCLVYVKLS